MVRVLFVCTGNICRSPTAAGILRSLVAEAGLCAQIEALSAATHGYHVGEPPDPRSIATAERHAIDIRDLRARQIAADDFATADLIVPMEQKHEQHLLKLCPAGLQNRIRRLMTYVPGSSIVNVPDPYFGDEGFEEVFQMIESGVVGLLDHILRTYPFDPPQGCN